MENTLKKCDLIIAELNKFDESIISLGPPVLDERFELFEDEIGYILPLDFKYISKKHNRIVLGGTEIYGIDKELRGVSLDEVYNFEHFEVYNRMPAEFLPFSPDGRGNHYCLNLSKFRSGLCPVVFWQWNFPYKSISD